MGELHPELQLSMFDELSQDYKHSFLNSNLCFIKKLSEKASSGTKNLVGQAFFELQIKIFLYFVQ